MSARVTKRPAHFDAEERESPKRPRKEELPPQDSRDGRTNGERGNHRPRSRSRERDGRGRGRGDRNGDFRGNGRDDRDRGRDRPNGVSRGSPPRGPRPDRSPRRSRSPRRNRSRDRSRDRGQYESDRQDRREPPRAKTNGTSAPSSKAPNNPVTSGTKADPISMDVDGMDDEDEEAQMLKVMGFGKFKSTKNTKVPGNDKLYGVRKEKQMTARQYMNRVGGFNRPLSPSQQ